MVHVKHALAVKHVECVEAGWGEGILRIRPAGRLTVVAAKPIECEGEGYIRRRGGLGKGG